MAKQVHIHIHRSKARDAGEGEGKGRWITLSPSGTHVKVDGNGEITAGPKGMTGKKPSELSKGSKKEGEVGYEEQQKYGKYFSKGEMVTTGSGKHHEVISHVGPAVETTGGRFHPTKISRVEKAPSTGAQGKPAKKVNLGTEKWPMMAKQESGGKIGGFEPPVSNADGMGNGKGDFIVAIGNDGYTFSREKTSFVTGKPVYEYNGPDGARVWVHPDGKVDFDDTIPANASQQKPAAQSKGKGETPLKGSAGPATAKTESYSWGKLTKVGNVNESAIAHPKDREQIAALADGDSYQYTDEQGKQWKVTRHGEQAAFYKANAAKPALVAPLGEFQDTPHDPTGMAHAGRPQGTAAVQARIDAEKATAQRLDSKIVEKFGSVEAFAKAYRAMPTARKNAFSKLLKENPDSAAAKAELADWLAQNQRPQQGGALAADWSSSNGNWESAKKSGSSLVEKTLSAAKTQGDKTDAMLALKTRAAEEHKKGSYLGAVVVGLVNDYFDRLR